MYAALSTLPADVEASSTEKRESCACVIRKSSDRADPAALGSPCCALFSLGLLYQVQVLCCVCCSFVRGRRTHGWSVRPTLSPLQSAHLVCNEDIMECSGVYHVPQEASGEQPCTHSWPSPRAAVQGLGTVVFQSTVMCFLPVKVLKASSCIVVSALM